MASEGDLGHLTWQLGLRVIVTYLDLEPQSLMSVEGALHVQSVWWVLHGGMEDFSRA